jgi:phospholipase C
VSFRATLALCVTTAAIVAPAAAAREAQTPIRHFVVLMQENHSFDNYFGTYAGANGIPEKICMPVDGRAKGGAACVRPFRLGGRAVPDLGHDRRMHDLQYAGGRMDGFVRAASIDRQKVERSVMGYYDGRDLPFYWKVAKDYVLFDRFFASAAGGSVHNHMFWVTGRPGLPGLPGRIPREGFGELPTVFDRLEAAGISWKFYVEDYDPRRSLETTGTADLSVQAARVPLLNFSRYVNDPKLFDHIVNLEEYYEDLRSGNLPEVAYIAPSRSSEHPPGRVEAGEDLVRGLLTALAMSDAWKSSAFLWTYDDWGGWFDHVRPPTVDGARHGFRVPALLVSPYARKGHIDSTRLETTSILRFIEDNWQLKPLARRDARAHSFEGAFDFSRPARAPLILAGEGRPGGQREPRRSGIYIGYGAALVLGGVLFGWVLLCSGSRSRAHLSCQLVAVAVALSALGATPAAAQPIQTVPQVPGMRFSLEGRVFEAGRDGRAYPPPGLGSSRAALRALDTEVAPGIRARFDRWYSGRRIAAIKLYYRVAPTFVDLSGRRVDPRVVTSVVMRGSHGRRYLFKGDRPHWLQGNRVVPESGGRGSTAIYYSAEKAMVAGSSVVHRAQQRFFPAKTRRMELRLLLFAARVTVRDALLGFPIGSAVRLEYPNGRGQRHALGPGAELTLTSLPRGDYRVSVDALGFSSSRPVALSRDQRVDLKVISWLDVAVVLLALASIALALLFLRRPGPILTRRRRRAARVTATLVVALTMIIAAPGARAASPPDRLFAYYYIWFNADSWNRAKTDYPLLGRYSSDERDVMRRHVHWAKQAGIDGFIVSWKSTPVLNRRLRRLAEVAEAERFKLLLIYQGLDFDREPLAASRVARDLDIFWSRFAKRKAFDVFAKPLVIWSGTPEFTRAQLGGVTGPWRGRLLLLASERNLDGYRRVADLVDGNAYYWGSVNPETYPDYPQKLAEMGKAIHERGGLWLAPAAPGFDARLVGGTSVVPRRDGATLRTQLDAATASAPDVLGLISWNEFSENTHIEPSRAHGSRYLEVVADVRGAELRELRDFDSSEPAATGVSYGVPLLGGFAFLLGASFLIVVRRARRRAAA